MCDHTGKPYCALNLKSSLFFVFFDSVTASVLRLSVAHFLGFGTLQKGELQCITIDTPAQAHVYDEDMTMIYNRLNHSA